MTNQPAIKQINQNNDTHFEVLTGESDKKYKELEKKITKLRNENQE